MSGEYPGQTRPLLTPEGIGRAQTAARTRDNVSKQVSDLPAQHLGFARAVRSAHLMISVSVALDLLRTHSYVSHWSAASIPTCLLYAAALSTV